jgi:hypothetical protein
MVGMRSFRHAMIVAVTLVGCLAPRGGSVRNPNVVVDEQGEVYIEAEDW